MSETELFTELTNLVEADPFALLGISVSADEKRISKRYRQIAKQLHPDVLAAIEKGKGLDPEIAAQVIARIVNPSYQKLKHENGRQEMLATLRFRVRRLARTEKLIPTFQSAQHLAQVEEGEVNVFYEQALSQLANIQFQSIQSLHAYALEMSQLNLIFLRRKMENLVIRPKRTGLLVNPVTPTAASNIPSGPANADHAAPTALIEVTTPPAVDYAQRHTERAKTYLLQQNYELAIQELREAVKLTPQNPEVHSMLGQVYYKQKLSGMAKTHFRQALRLKPTHKVAQKYSKLLGISAEEVTRRPTAKESEKVPKRPWLGKLLRR